MLYTFVQFFHRINDFLFFNFVFPIESESKLKKKVIYPSSDRSKGIKKFRPRFLYWDQTCPAMKHAEDSGIIGAISKSN